MSNDLPTNLEVAEAKLGGFCSKCKEYEYILDIEVHACRTCSAIIRLNEMINRTDVNPEQVLAVINQLKKSRDLEKMDERRRAKQLKRLTKGRT